MSTIGRACARIVLAGALVVAVMGLVHAAGALAIGPCGAYGTAYDYPGAEAARKEAIRKCTGKGCKVVASMKLNCAAFAVDLRNACGSYGFASAARLGPAQNTALKQCYSNGGKDCVIRAFVCDARG
jgi:NAD(P)-dependent dehydrogenase (short-subunit alcohol dehydrogenase family)